MTSGFRSQTSYEAYAYKKYDASGVDAASLTSAPSLDGLPYELLTHRFVLTAVGVVAVVWWVVRNIYGW